MSHGTTVCNVCMHTLCCSCVHVQCRARYLLQCCQVLVHSQSISQGSGSIISNYILFKTVEESTLEFNASSEKNIEHSDVQSQTHFTSSHDILISPCHHSMASITSLHTEESDQSVVQLRSPNHIVYCVHILCLQVSIGREQLLT